jgi:hypothetical protein
LRLSAYAVTKPTLLVRIRIRLPISNDYDAKSAEEPADVVYISDQMAYEDMLAAKNEYWEHNRIRD